jgi:hypothetical protein
MTTETKKTLFNWFFAGAALFYTLALASLWLAPNWGTSGTSYLLTGVLPAFFGVLCTILAIALHADIREEDSTGREGF